MIPEENPIQYPLFYPCTQSEWEQLNAAADELLGFGNEGADTYSTPMIDKFGNYHFLVNPEVKQLVDLSKCVEYSAIQFPEITHP